MDAQTVGNVSIIWKFIRDSLVEIQMKMKISNGTTQNEVLLTCFYVANIGDSFVFNWNGTFKPSLNQRYVEKKSKKINIFMKKFQIPIGQWQKYGWKWKIAIGSYAQNVT